MTAVAMGMISVMTSGIFDSRRGLPHTMKIFLIAVKEIRENREDIKIRMRSKFQAAGRVE